MGTVNSPVLVQPAGPAAQHPRPGHGIVLEGAEKGLVLGKKRAFRLMAARTPVLTAPILRYQRGRCYDERAGEGELLHPPGATESFV